MLPFRDNRKKPICRPIWPNSFKILKISFLRLSRKGSILGHMLLHNININTHISNILVYLRNLYDLQKSRYQTSRAFKISFLRFSRKVSILVHMLLHNININVAIANISMQFLSLYEPQEPRYPKINSKHFHCSLNCP